MYFKLFLITHLTIISGKSSYVFKHITVSTQQINRLDCLKVLKKKSSLGPEQWALILSPVV